MKSGFTLIELLITVSIISILATIGLTVYSGVVVNARDSSRKQDLARLATALEVLYQQTGQYVTPASLAADSCSRDTSKFYAEIAPYMQNNIAPQDPLSKTSYCYISVNNGQAFRLYTKLENCSDKDMIIGINCQTAAWNYNVVSDNLTISPAP